MRSFIPKQNGSVWRKGENFQCSDLFLFWCHRLFSHPVTKKEGVPMVNKRYRTAPLAFSIVNHGLIFPNSTHGLNTGFLARSFSNYA